MQRAVGLIALSRLYGESGSCIFVEELFVHPQHRRRGIGRELLEQAGLFSDGTCNQTVACVVRRYAEQQSAARTLYERLGMRPRRVPRLHDSGHRQVVLRPKRNGVGVRRDDVEAYLSGPREDIARPPRLRPDVVVDGERVMKPARFLRKHPQLASELRRHHALGDGADADAVLLQADVVMVAYLSRR